MRNPPSEHIQGTVQRISKNGVETLMEENAIADTCQAENTWPSIRPRRAQRRRFGAKVQSMLHRKVLT